MRISIMYEVGFSMSFENVQIVYENDDELAFQETDSLKTFAINKRRVLLITKEEINDKS